MRYLLTGGGTGGHVYPALAIADELRRRQPDARFLYVGHRHRLESRVVPARGYPIRFVCSRPYPRTLSPVPLALFAVSLALGVARSILILLAYRPQIIIGTGGYVSAPILFAHGILRKFLLSRARVFVYEPNARPGLLNQAVGRLADRVGVAFEHAARWFDMKRVAVVGYPIRRELLDTDREDARRRLGIPPDRRVVLVFGGSGGSRAINRAVIDALATWRQRSDLLILHVTGRYSGPDYDAVRDTVERLREAGIGEAAASWYRRFDYLDEIQWAYAAADAVVCRGGAGTLTEVAVCGLPSIVVPKPEAADDHQAANARQIEQQGAARVLYQQAAWEEGRVVSRLDGQRLAAAVGDLLDSPVRLAGMAAAARSLQVRGGLELILGELEGLASGRRPAPLSLQFPPPVNVPPADPNQLLRWARERVQAAGGVAAMDRHELAYLRYQADRLLASEGWYEIPLGRRNVGVKLVGCLCYLEHLPLLLAILTDRAPVSPLRRLLGGDFRHGGLLRRNVIEQGLGALRVADPQVRDALLVSLSGDPYFEARAAAADALGELFAPDPETERALIAALDDPAPAVVVRAIRALGRLGQHADLQQALARFDLADNWQFRRELVVALRRLLERGVVSTARVADHLAHILPTAPYFEAGFPLNEELARLEQRVRAVTDPVGHEDR